MSRARARARGRRRHGPGDSSSTIPTIGRSNAPCASSCRAMVTRHGPRARIVRISEADPDKPRAAAVVRCPPWTTSRVDRARLLQPRHPGCDAQPGWRSTQRPCPSTTATFTDDAAELAEIPPPATATYSRLGNPTAAAMASAVAELERAEAGFAFAWNGGHPRRTGGEPPRRRGRDARRLWQHAPALRPRPRVSASAPTTSMPPIWPPGGRPAWRSTALCRDHQPPTVVVADLAAPARWPIALVRS